MDVLNRDDFDKVARATLLAEPLLQSCRVLLGWIYVDLHARLSFDLADLRRELKGAPIAEAIALLAKIDGRQAPAEPLFDLPIDWLSDDQLRSGPLSADQCTELENAGIQTIGDLLKRAPEDLIILDGFDAATLRRLEGDLRQARLALRRSEAGPVPDSPIFQMHFGAVIWQYTRTAAGALALAGIQTVADLVRWSRADLLALDGMGPKGVDGIEDGLEHYGLKLAAEETAAAEAA